MINGTDHIPDSLLIFKSPVGLNFADKACCNYFMSFKLYAACMPSAHPCIQADREKQAATDEICTDKKFFTISYDPGISWTFK